MHERITPDQHRNPRLIIVDECWDGQSAFGEIGNDYNCYDTTADGAVLLAIDNAILRVADAGTVNVGGVVFAYAYNRRATPEPHSATLANQSLRSQASGRNDMTTITKSQVSLNQGEDINDRVFGYVAGDDGGFFFTWMDTLEETLDSIEVDEEAGNGGLCKSDVREFLADYLPATPAGRKREWQAAE